MDLSSKNHRDQLRAEAARWVVRLCDEASAEDLALFSVWRATSLEHELAYERVLASWRRLDRLASLRAPQIVPDPDLLLSLTSSPQRRSPRIRRLADGWLAMAACLLLTVGLGFAVFTSVIGAPAYATGIGERRLIVLTDGTRVELNTNSRIVVRYSEDRREVELVQGQAMLHIATGPQPFVLRTKAGRLRAKRSAEVDVQMVGSTAKVTVKQGSIESLDSPTSGARVLGASSAALVSSDHIQVATIAEDAVIRQLAWREGAIALNGQTIDEAVAEINRYNTRQIIVNDRDTGDMRVGGYFQTHDIDEFSAALSKAFALSVVRQSDGDIVLLANPRAPAPPQAAAAAPLRTESVVK